MEIYNGISGGAPYRLSGAILLYHNGTATLPTIHNVEVDDNNAAIILAGHTLTFDEFREIQRAIQAVPQKREIMPANVLLAEPDTLMWYTPSQRRAIWFKTHDATFTREVSGAQVWHPALLFIAHRSSLRVLALATDERPTADTPAYRAPYFNLGHNGAMCAGNARLPENVFPSSAPQWEECFFSTFFTHSNCSQEETMRKGGHNALWRSMRAAQKFRTSSLRPMRKTVGEIINP